MTPDELMDDEAARNAEDVFGSKFGSLAAPPKPFTFDDPRHISKRGVDPASFDVSDAAMRQYTQQPVSGMEQLGRNVDASINPVAGEYTRKAGGNLLDLAGAGFDAGRSLPMYAATKAERLLGGNATGGTFGDEKMLAAQLAKPIWGILGQGEQLANEAGGYLAEKQFGLPVSPVQRTPDVSIPHGDTLAGEQFRRAGEELSAMNEPTYGLGEKALLGLGAGIRLANVVGNPFGGAKEFATDVFPYMSQAQKGYQFGPTVGEAAGAVGKSLVDAFPESRGINFPSSGAPVRRGVFNLLPGEESPANNAMKRVLDMAHKVIDPKGWAKKDLMKLSDESRDAVFALADPIIQETGGVEKYAAMDDAHLEQALRNNLREANQAERPWQTARSLDAPTGASEEGGSIGTMISKQGSREARAKKVGTERAEKGLTPEQRQANFDLAVDAIKSTDSPEGVAAAVKKFKSVKAKTEGGVPGSNQILRDLGITPGASKDENIKLLESYFERKFETPPPPTTPEGLQAANEMEVAQQASDAAQASRENPSVSQPNLPETQGIPRADAAPTRYHSLSPEDALSLLESSHNVAPLSSRSRPTEGAGISFEFDPAAGSSTNHNWKSFIVHADSVPERVSGEFKDVIVGKPGSAFTERWGPERLWRTLRDFENKGWTKEALPDGSVRYSPPPPTDPLTYMKSERSRVQGWLDDQKAKGYFGGDVEAINYVKELDRNINAMERGIGGPPPHASASPPPRDVRVLEPEEPPMMTDEGPASLPPPRSAGAEGVSPTEGVPHGQVENRYGETAEIPGEENWAHQTPRQNGVVPSGHQGSGSEAIQGQRAEVLKRGPIRTSTPTEGAWQGVRRPENPMTPEGPIEPNPPRRAPIQGPKPEPKSAPERYDTGAALNHVDTLENAASRAGNAAGRKLAEDLRETISYGESNAARPLAEWNDGVKAVADNPKALAEIADVGGGEGLVAPAAWKRAGAGNWRVGRFQANVDGNAAKMGIRPEEVALTQPESQALVENYWRRRAETGKEAELLGVKTANGRPFKAMVKRFVQRPDSAAKKWMVDGNPEFEDFLKEAHAIYPFAEPNAMRSGLKSWAAGSLDRPAAFEFERAFPMLPAARVSRRTGELMPLLVDAVVPTAINTEGAGAQLIRSEWMRLGGIKHMGQDVTLAMADDPANVAGLLNNLPLGKALAADPATLDAAKGAIGAVYGRAEAGVLGGTPVAETSLATSRSPWIQLLRTTVSKGVGLLNLGLQGLKSVPQTLGEVPAMTGAANFAKAVAAVAMKHGMTSDEARLAGALHEKFLMEGSKVFDRHRLTESILSQNINRFPTERLNDFVKDLNDTIAFTAGKFKGEEMLAKGSKTSDHLMMDEMNLPQSTQDVFRNPANYTEAEQAKAVEDFGRRVAQETQFHAKNRALKGRFENDQWLRYVLPYLQYSINTAKRTYRDFERVWRMSGKGIDEDANMFSQFMQRMNPFGDSREQFRTAVKRLVYRTTGMELSGEMIADLSAEFQGKDPLRRDRSVLARFLENLKYASFLGPFQVIADQLSAHVLKGLGNDSKETIKSFADSKPIELQNPAAEAAIKTGMKALKGDFGGAAYEATVRQSPLATGVGRATGIMDPAGSRHANGKTKTPSAGKGFFDDLGGGGKKGMFDELKGGRKGGGMFDELGKGKSKKGFFD